MTEKSDSTHGEPLDPQSNGSAEPSGAPAREYTVGPGRPPVDTRFKKGAPSPNPRGRPRKDRSMIPDLKKAFEEALNRKVGVTRGDKKVFMTRAEMGIEQLLNDFAKGDRYARRDLLEYADKLGVDFLAEHRKAIEDALAPDQQAILDGYVARHGAAAQAAPAQRVLAPPQLLDDDDAAEPEPTSAAPPKPESKPKIPPPTPIPGKIYPKPPERMTSSELRAWHREWYARNGAAWEKQRLEQQKAAPQFSQDSLGPGRPRPGGFSMITGLPS